MLLYNRQSSVSDLVQQNSLHGNIQPLNKQCACHELISFELCLNNRIMYYAKINFAPTDLKKVWYDLES